MADPVGARRSQVAIVLLALVGAMFTWRYSARVVSFSGAAALAYALALVGLFAILRRVDFAVLPAARSGRAFAGVAIGLTAAAGLVVALTPEQTEVARLPALADWIADVEAGAFPWAVHVNAPSSFPFMYVLAWPFDWLGNLGLLEVVGVAALGLVIWHSSTSANTRWLRLATALLLPPLFYEPIVRSELLFNTVLVVALVIFAERRLDPARLDAAGLALAVAFGLLLSTRTVVALVYGCYFAYRFRDHLRQGVVFSALVAILFALTLAPFLVWDAGAFFDNGPFASQSRGSELPAWVAVPALAAAIVAGRSAPSLDAVLFRLGLILFAVVAAALVPQLIDDGDATILAETGYDLGYFVFCVPFLLLSLTSARDCVQRAPG